MAIDFFMIGLSLRQVEGVLNLMGQSFGFDAPDHTTVRLWALRMGLYLWQRTPPKASDWIWIVDHVAQAVVSKLGDHAQLDAIVQASDQGRRRYTKNTSLGWSRFVNDCGRRTFRW